MWLSIIAYTIRLGVKLGLVKTEPDSAQSRAYIRAHDGLHWLRSQLLESRLTQVEATVLGFTNKGRQYTIRFDQGKMTVSPSRPRVRRAIPLTFEPQLIDEMELGPQSFVLFGYESEQLQIQLQAGDDSTDEVGVSKVELHLRIDWEDGEMRRRCCIEKGSLLLSMDRTGE